MAMVVWRWGAGGGVVVIALGYDCMGSQRVTTLRVECATPAGL